MAGVENLCRYYGVGSCGSYSCTVGPIRWSYGLDDCDTRSDNSGILLVCLWVTGVKAGGFILARRSFCPAASLETPFFYDKFAGSFFGADGERHSLFCNVACVHGDC